MDSLGPDVHIVRLLIAGEADSNPQRRDVARSHPSYVTNATNEALSSTIQMLEKRVFGFRSFRASASRMWCSGYRAASSASRPRRWAAAASRAVTRRVSSSIFARRTAFDVIRARTSGARVRANAKVSALSSSTPLVA